MYDHSASTTFEPVPATADVNDYAVPETFLEGMYPWKSTVEPACKVCPTPTPPTPV